MSDQTIVLGDGETAVVGYGLLLLRDTVDTTLGHVYEGPFVACHIEGWRRSWSVSMPNAAFYYDEGGTRAYPERILYMSARPDPSTSMNCTVFVLDGDELAAMHGREWIYDPVAVNSDLRGVRVAVTRSSTWGSPSTPSPRRRAHVSWRCAVLSFECSPMFWKHSIPRSGPTSSAPRTRYLSICS